MNFGTERDASESMTDCAENGRRAAEVPRVVNLILTERDLIDLARIPGRRRMRRGARLPADASPKAADAPPRRGLKVVFDGPRAGPS